MKEANELRDFWLTREGSQKGQYRLNHEDAGVLFQRIGDLETILQQLSVNTDRLGWVCSRCLRYNPSSAQMCEHDHNDEKHMRLVYELVQT